MRLGILILMLQFFFCGAQAQMEDWLKVKNSTTGVSVSFPKAPAYSNEQILFDNVLIQREVYDATNQNVHFFFVVQDITGESNKALKHNSKMAFDFIAGEHQGDAKKSKLLQENGLPQYYIEIPLASGDLIRAIAFKHYKSLILVYIKGSISDVYNDNSNQFLDSWKTPNVVAVNSTETTEKVKKRKEKTPVETPTWEYERNWIKVAIDEQINLEFPNKPFMQKTIVEKGSNDFQITAFSYTDLNTNLQYIVTKRTYAAHENGLSDSALIDYVEDRIIAKKKLKLIHSNESDEGREMLFSHGLKYYRLKLLKHNNTLYQMLVKGKRKSIKNADANYFFEQQLLNN